MTKRHKRWPGGRPHKARNLGPSDQKRKAARAGRIHESNIATVTLDPVVLESMKVSELRDLCTARGIPTTTKIRKAGLIEMLVGR